MVTGCGLASVIRAATRAGSMACMRLGGCREPVQYRADLGGMAEGMQMVTGIHAYFWTIFLAALIMALLLWTSYRTMARVFKC